MVGAQARSPGYEVLSFDGILVRDIMEQQRAQNKRQNFNEPGSAKRDQFFPSSLRGKKASKYRAHLTNTLE